MRLCRSEGASTVPSVSLPRCFARSSRLFVRFRKFCSYFSRSLSPIVTPLKRTGLRTKNPSRGYHKYSRLAPHRSISPGPRNSTRSSSSRMYCCTFFQFSSRRTSTCAIKASSSAVAWAKVGVTVSPRAVMIASQRTCMGSPEIYVYRALKGAWKKRLEAQPFVLRFAQSFLPCAIEFHHARPYARCGAVWTLREEPCVSVPHRRRPRAELDASEYQRWPDIAPAGQQDTAVARRCAQRLEQRDV